MQFIESQAAALPALRSKFEDLGSLYEKKLWHQLTEALDELLDEHGDQVGASLYTDFIAHFEARLNQVRLVLLVSRIGHSFDDHEKSLELFNSLLKSRTRMGVEAAMCVDMDIALVDINRGKLDEVKKNLEESKTALAKISSSETAPFSKFYKASAAYRKRVGPPTEFYTCALMYLSYTPVEMIPAGERYTLATDVAMSAITGEDIYNFGEVLATPILGYLKDTPNQWMCDLVTALHMGDIDKFNVIIDTNRDKYSAHEALVSSLGDLKKKVVLLTLMNIAFERSANDRQIKFTDIAARAHIDLDQVEWVIMRAMSLNLVKGYIDQVDQFVNITWVQPRTLDKQQMGIVAEQLDAWAARVRETHLSVEEQTAELFV